MYKRQSFLVTPADTVTVYTAQGGTYDAIVADMQRPPYQPLAMHWLACYDMISKARSLGGFLVLRPATRKELSAGLPQYLVDELDRLRRLEKESHKDLVKYIESLSIDLPPRIMELLRVDAAREQVQQVKAARSGGKSRKAAESASSHFATKKRIFGKRSPGDVLIHSFCKKQTNDGPSQAESPSTQVASTSSSEKKPQDNVIKEFEKKTEEDHRRS